jgi:predicted nuclease of predicted toxin-antitoxin system
LSLRFKLDENLDPRCRLPLEEAGHQVSTVAEESLSGADDETIARTCRDLQLCLVTADLDFSQILDYPPEHYAGLVVIRHPKPTLAGLHDLIRQVALLVREESPIGKLWIIEPGRVRMHLPLDPTGS